MRTGHVLDGRYELVRSIGGGGMGSVWEARVLSSGRRVAIKALHEHLVEEKDLVARFLREGQAAMESQYSGHIIEVVDVVNRRGRPPYLVMEYLEGDALSQVVKSEGALEIVRAVKLVIQACHAVAEVHRQGIIHRDIKPDNLFVTTLNDGTEWIKLLDFGVAKFRIPPDSLSRPLTAVGSAVGTPHYMAPEQILTSQSLDHRLDIYSMGVVLYELLTGTRPYKTGNIAELVMIIAQGEPPRPSEIRPEIERNLERVVSRAMAVDRDNRYDTMFDMAEALEPHSHAEVSRIEGIFAVETIRTKIEKSATTMDTNPAFSMDDEERRVDFPRITGRERTLERSDLSGLPLLYDEEDDDETRLAPKSSGTPSSKLVLPAEVGPSSALPFLYPNEDESKTRVANPHQKTDRGRSAREATPSHVGAHAEGAHSASLPQMYPGRDDDETMLASGRGTTPSHPPPRRREESAASSPRKAGTVVVGSSDDVQSNTPVESTSSSSKPAAWHTPPEEPPPPSLRQRTETALRNFKQSRIALYVLVGLAVVAVAVSMMVGLAVLTGDMGGSTDDEWIIEK